MRCRRFWGAWLWPPPAGLIIFPISRGMKTAALLLIGLSAAALAFWKPPWLLWKRPPVLLKAGERQWTLPEFEKLLSWRLRSFEGLERIQPPEELASIKQELVDELIFQALAEGWARRASLKIPPPKASLKEEEAARRLRLPLELLLAYKSQSALRQKLQRHLLKRAPDPPFKAQKDFYLRRKKAFFEPPACFLNQILVSSGGLGKSLRQRLSAGEDFKKLASLYSEKGHPGWAEQGRLKIFDRACALEAGAISPLWESGYGFHIFQVKKKRPGRQKPFAEAQGQILKKLKEAGKENRFQSWLKGELQKKPVFIDKKLLDQIHIQYKN